MRVKADPRPVDSANVGLLERALPWRRNADEDGVLAERRGEVRVQPAPDEPVQVQIMGEHSLDIVNARDISVSGVGVYVPHGFDGSDDASVELVITLPGERPFLASGVIRHLTEPGAGEAYFGVEFTFVADEHRCRIRDYIAALRSG